MQKQKGKRKLLMPLQKREWKKSETVCEEKHGKRSGNRLLKMYLPIIPIMPITLSRQS